MRSFQENPKLATVPLCAREAGVSAEHFKVAWEARGGEAGAVGGACLCLLQTAAAGEAVRYRNGGGGVGRRLANFQAFGG